MLNNPIKIWRELKNIYLKYIDSGLPLIHNKYIQERRALYEKNSAICQPPIIEFVPKYDEVCTLTEACKDLDLDLDFADFARLGLFPDAGDSERKLYKHQKEALKQALKERRHIVATTGTGSGKTECFLLPVISDLITESKNWTKNRTRAVRTLILYPLNALAEDQMIRLRRSLNSSTKDQSGSRDWLKLNRDDKIYFGRYTGKTPTSGNKEKSSSKSKNREAKKQHERDWRASKDAFEKTSKDDLLYHVPCMDDDSAEMWDRWSMQENPPDVLITNYSMLNIMLMRKQEENIFEQTRKWLEEDKENHVFHLVVDEMHTYRGTAGTEVAYLLRLLFNKLGLDPDSPQIQFLASSASMQDNDKTKDYLSAFFGVDRTSYGNKFALISNDPHQSIQNAPSEKLPVGALSLLGEHIQHHGDINNESKELFLTSVNCKSFTEFISEYSVVDWLKFVMQDGERIVAQKATELTNNLFGENSLKPLEALLFILCENGKKENGTVIQPIRSHNFFRNIDGLWGCSNSDCSEVSDQFKWNARKVGKLYRGAGKKTCNCGSKIYELLLCRSCGELFLSGYLEGDSDKGVLKPMKPSNKPAIATTVWKKKSEADNSEWKNCSLNSQTGKLECERTSTNSFYKCESKNKPPFPANCPNCFVTYNVDDENSLTPLSRHTTGVQKVNQVMADAMMRSMKNNGLESPKLVLFSDSRQAAAKLSAGIELDHYRDVLRQVVINSLEEENEKKDILRKLREQGRGSFTIEENEKYSSIRNESSFRDIIYFISDEKEDCITSDDIAKLNAFFEKGIPPLNSIEAKVSDRIAWLGINPAGPKPSLMTYKEEHWKQLIDWKSGKRYNDGHKAFFREQIDDTCDIEQLITIFAHKSRSFEAMKIGHVTANLGLDYDNKFTQFVDIAIRILGEHWRILGYESRFMRTSFPKSLGKFAEAVFGTKMSFRPELIDLLESKKIISNSEKALTGKGLFFRKTTTGDKYWLCERCNSVHLHPSCGVCYNCCNKPLVEMIITDDDLNDSSDYYSFIAQTAEPYRLRCEELTGQTSKEDSTKRQRLFQDIFLDNEEPQVDAIDLLSVTTTMEAGVDIGSLSTVMMGNVPPQRFNYQQRVGRAGRRGHALSVALTIAKGNSHDQTHFFQTERMVSATPKDPYLETRSSEIAKRMIIRQVLEKSFDSTDLDNLSGNVHGEFGQDYKWEKNKTFVQSWINNNDRVIEAVIDCVIKETKLDQTRDEIQSYITNDLITKIDEIVANKVDYPQTAISEKLANAGLLPMFGFPTRVRLLYEEKPNKLPSEKVVDRNLDIAISSFAPGSEIVKDKQILKAIGFVTYEKSYGEIKEKTGINELKKSVQVCNSCGFTSIKGSDLEKCKQCGGEIDKIIACSPLGFCVDYKAEKKDFNGRFDFKLSNTDVSLDASSDLGKAIEISNLSIKSNISPENGIVHQLNTNNGELFTIGKLIDSQIYCDINHVPENSQVSDKKEYALIASKTTGVLAVSIKSPHPDLDLNVLPYTTRNWQHVTNAFISWGYLLQKSICSYLDIESNEIEVGYHVNSVGKGEVYIVEKLENGAGYCNYLSGREGKEITYQALVEPLLEAGTFYLNLTNPEEHLKNCSSSCYDCLRDYNNQKYHGILDWRLALDLAKVSGDSSKFVDFDSSYWRAYFLDLGKRKEKLLKKISEGLFIISPEKKKVLISHPFWSKNYIKDLVSRYKCDEDVTVCELDELYL